MDVAQARIETLGGRLVEIVHERTGDTHRRMADPEGNEFTILAPLPPELAAQVYGSTPELSRGSTRLDQAAGAVRPAVTRTSRRWCGAKSNGPMCAVRCSSQITTSDSDHR